MFNKKPKPPGVFSCGYKWCVEVEITAQPPDGVSITIREQVPYPNPETGKWDVYASYGEWHLDDKDARRMSQEDIRRTKREVMRSFCRQRDNQLKEMCG